MSEVPVRGQAVHGPMVTASKLRPRVDVVHVAPKPTAVAIASAMLVVLAISAVWGNRGLLHLWRLQEQLSEVETSVVRLQRENHQRREHLRRLRSDPAYMERIVRQRLGWVREGEILYRVHPETER